MTFSTYEDKGEEEYEKEKKQKKKRKKLTRRSSSVFRPAHLPWVDCPAGFSAGGVPQTVLLASSTALLTLSWLRGLLNGRSDVPLVQSQIAWPYETVTLAGLGLAILLLSPAVSSDSLTHHPLDALTLSYVAILRLVRLAVRINVHRVLFAHINLIFFGIFMLLAARHLLPCVDTAVACRPPLAAIGALASMSVSAVAAAFTPALWIPPPPDHPKSEEYRKRGPTLQEICSPFVYYCSYSWSTPLILKGWRGRIARTDVSPVPWYDEPLLMLREMQAARVWGRTTFWTVTRFAGRDMFGVTVHAVLNCLSSFLSPLALYQLLAYLSDPDSAVVRPSVWVALMCMSSIACSCLHNRTMLASSRLAVHVDTGLKLELYQRAMSCMELDEETFSGAKKSSSSSSSSSSPPPDDKQAKATATGRIASLISSDVSDIHGARIPIELASVVPFGLLVPLAALYYLLGWIAVVGTVFLALAAPASALLAARVQRFHRALRECCDVRVSVVSEYLASIRALKYFAWEDVAAGKIGAARDAELDYLWKIIFFHVWPGLLAQLVPSLALMVVFVLYVTVARRQLDAATGFTVMLLLAKVKQYADLIGPVVDGLGRFRTSLGRIDRFFEATVSKEQCSAGPLQIREETCRRTRTANFSLRDISIDFVQGGLNVCTGSSGSGKSTLLLAILGETFREGGGSMMRPERAALATQSAWLRNTTVRDSILFCSPMDEERYAAVIRTCCLDVDLAEMPGGDLAQTGESGSALSGGQRARVALARALYSDAPLLLLDDVFAALDANTAARVWERCFCSDDDSLREKTVVLVTQLPWIVAQADLVVIMQNGSVSSTERRPGVLRRSAPGVDAVDAGSDKEGNDMYHNEKKKYEKEHKRIKTKTASEASGSMAAFIRPRSKEHDDGPVVEQDWGEVEEQERGEVVRLSFYYTYMSYFGSARFGFMCVAVMLLSKMVSMGRTGWLSVWVESRNDGGGEVVVVDREEGQGRHQPAAGTFYFLVTYGVLTVLDSVVQGLATLAFSAGSWRAGRRLHGDLVRSVFGTSLAWWRSSSVTVGSVLGRFAGDMAMVDDRLHVLFRDFASNFLSLLLRLAVVSSLTTMTLTFTTTTIALAVAPAAILCALAVVVGELYTRTTVTMTWFVSSTHGPVFSQFADSLAGLAVIRAGGERAQAVFAEGLARRMRAWAAASEGTSDCHLWVSARMNLASACVGLLAGVVAVSNAGAVTAGMVGLSLSNAMELSDTILSVVRMMNELDIISQNFERVEVYAKLESEDAHDDPLPDERRQEEKGENEGGKEEEEEEEEEKEEGDKSMASDHPPSARFLRKDWPASGEIEFRNVTVRYDPNGPDILANINLRFRAGERVAVVGRTGAGKSTLVLSILRFAHVVEGEILYDGVNIAQVPRRRLRRSVTIIPQEATLFNGTVAFNLDPTGQVARGELQHALDLCRGVASFGDHHTDADGNSNRNSGQSQSQSRTVSLDTPVRPLGENFSHGQRQVLSLCRALVRDGPLMLLDEATANMDYETDRGIQAVLRRKVEEEKAGRGRTTLVTVAHRLRTVVDYDAVVVMGGGRVIETGSPRELYRAKGAFYDMVRHSGELRDLAMHLGA